MSRNISSKVRVCHMDLKYSSMFSLLTGEGSPDDVCPITNKKYKDKKSKEEYSYSYDEFMQWSKNGFEFKGYGKHHDVLSQYSDRLFQFDSAKYNVCCQEVFGNRGQYWGQRSPKGIEQFLRMYLENPSIQLVYVIEGCNPSNGYPYWVFGYKVD